MSSCTEGALVTVPVGYEPNEASAALRSDGVIVVSSRSASPTQPTEIDTRVWMTSGDGGATLTWIGEQSGYTGQPAMGAFINLSPDGGEGPYGGLVHGAPASSTTRSDYQIRNVNGATGAFSGGYRPFTTDRYISYSHLIDIDGEEVLCLIEGGPDANFNTYCNIDAAVLRLHNV